MPPRTLHPEAQSVKGALARSTLKTGAMLGLRVVTQATVLVLLTRLLGPGAYGDFVAVASLAVMLGLLPNLGAGFIMLSRSATGRDAVASVWSYAWPLSTVLGLILLSGFVIAARFVTPIPLPFAILTVLGASELLAAPFTMLFSFALQACERVPRSQFVQWLPLGLRILAALPCFWLSPAHRLPVYVVMQFAASVVGAVLGYFVSKPYVALDWRPRWASQHELREGVSYALMHLVTANPSELDKVIAARAVGSHEAGIYAATARVMAATVMPVTAMLLASQPRLFRHACESPEQGRRLIQWVALLAFAWGSLSGVALVLASHWLPLILGASFQASSDVMPWLAAAAPFLSLRLAAGTVLAAQGRPMQRIAFELAGMTVLSLGMLVLAPLLGIGGIAAALVSAELTMAFAGWWMLVRRLRRQLTALS